jgi:YVTN family beta-propeller protein
MKIKFPFLLMAPLLGVLVLFQSCRKDDNAGKGGYQPGVLVANEGQFGSSNGDVTFYRASPAILDQNIYKTVNGSFAGNVLESIFIDGNTGYLVLNADNKIEIIDDNTFQLKNTFTDTKLINPRYLQVINGKAYISVWGAYDSNFDLVDSYILVVDLKTLQVVTTIDTDEGVENLLYNGQYLFASDYDFGASNTVMVIDPSTNAVVKVIKVHGGPAGMVIDTNNKVWVITTGSDAELVRINPATFAVEDSIAVAANPGVDLGISADKSTLIYTVGDDVYQLPIAAATASSNPLFTASDIVSLYAMGIDPATGDIYLGDALNYSSAGEVYIYTAAGTYKTKFESGIAPGQFIFR